MWNQRLLIPPPTNFLNSPSNAVCGKNCADFKSVIQRVRDGKELNGSHLKAEGITLGRLLYKHNNAQRSWKRYQLLVRLKKCLELLSESSIYSYADTMLSCWDSSQEASRDDPSPVDSLPSRQMLEYLLVMLQGHAKLTTHIALLCEQSGVLMVQTIQNGMFLSNNLVVLSIVSRVRVLICRLLKYVIAWYDDLIPYISYLPATRAAWCSDGMSLPTSLLEWLGEEAKQLTTKTVRKSKATSQKPDFLGQLFGTIQDSGGIQQEEVARQHTQAASPHASLADLGEMLSVAEVNAIMAGYPRDNSMVNVSPAKKHNTSGRQKRAWTDRFPTPDRRHQKLQGQWPQGDVRDSSRMSPQTKQRRGRSGKWKIMQELKKRIKSGKFDVSTDLPYYQADEQYSHENGSDRTRNPLGHKVKRLSKNVVTAIIGRRDTSGPRSTSISRQRRGSNLLRRSLSRDSTMSTSSKANDMSVDQVRGNPGKKIKLHQCVNRLRLKRKQSGRTDRTKTTNCLVIANQVTVSDHDTSGSLQEAGRNSQIDKGCSTSAGQNTRLKGVRKARVRKRNRLNVKTNKAPESLHPVYTQQIPALMSGRESSQHPKPSKNGKIGKRLWRMKQHFLRKSKDKKALQNIPRDSLHYANYVSFPLPYQEQHQQHQHHEIPTRHYSHYPQREPNQQIYDNQVHQYQANKFLQSANPEQHWHHQNFQPALPANSNQTRKQGIPQTRGGQHEAQTDKDIDALFANLL